MSLLIRNANIANADSSQLADIFIEKGVIQAVGVHLSTSAERVIEATGKVVIPGAVDVHTHMNIDMGFCQSCDDFYSGTVAAAFGGTTAIVDHMGFGPAGCSLMHQLEVYHQWASAQAVIDYGFHGTIQHVDEQILNEMPEMIAKGVSSFKLYLTYGYKLSDYDALRALKRLGSLGAITCVHPENDDVIRLNKEQLQRSEMMHLPIAHALSRPAECETEAITRMLNLAKLADEAPLYIVHLSNGLGLDYLRLARQKQRHVYVETCPQYLFLSDERYRQPNIEDGLCHILSPPLREKHHQAQLWQGLQDGSIDTVATDHCAFTRAQKRLGLGDINRCPNGLPGVETRLPLMFSEGVSQGRITINKLVELLCTRPAQLFGLTNKGAIKPGFDADIVIIDPSTSETIQANMEHSKAGFTPYAGMECNGFPEYTIARGEVIVEGGELHAQAGRGRYIARSLAKL
ncbi:dihydropyrimidinase [Aliagarivorans taiwanensis]|uniref:dihydropyrimidinase n=1 Tax=Aliagarivorans taiwanensis TaxID=561966 RepID=UPI00041D96A4|nr:dihydropyrimidinase [Aliagarivorans taiwanensis]